ncbi:gamma-butyrobetaine dioxygenase-like [Diadema antillarum]|uniref:gamma-butyrobetaine dioxygenase-like n=1 Tax=Diadema antillarum TaxID=105358 RepID=UPI003A85D138
MNQPGDTIVRVEQAPDWYELTWTDGYTGRYPFVWLRDNCRCHACYHASSKERSSLLSNLDVDVQPTNEALTNGGQTLKVSWPDGCTSDFPANWLYRMRFEKTKFDPVKELVPKPWGAEMLHNIPRFDYDKVMEDPKVFKDWLTTLVVTGLALIQGAPKETGVIEQIGKHVGHLRTTMYGRTFQVEAIASSSNLAYTTKALGLHVDLPMYDYPPSVQMLHCIKQVETIGGESQYADAMKVANDLKLSDPDVYHTLTTLKVDFRLRGVDFIPYHYQFAKPVILLDERGEFKYLSFNNGVRAPYINCPVEDVKQFYRSLKLFESKIVSKENMIEIKLREGDVVAFNNNRVMHGRSSFRMVQNEKDGKKTRHLEGGYLNWDAIYSRIRLLEEEVNGMVVL